MGRPAVFAFGKGFDWGQLHSSRICHCGVPATLGGLSCWHLNKPRHTCKARGHSQSVGGFVEKRKAPQDSGEQAQGHLALSAGRSAVLASLAGRAAVGGVGTDLRVSVGGWGGLTCRAPKAIMTQLCRRKAHPG